MAAQGMLLQILMDCPLVLVIVTLVDMLLDCSRKYNLTSLLLSSYELSIHIKRISLHVILHILHQLRVIGNWRFVRIHVNMLFWYNAGCSMFYKLSQINPEISLDKDAFIKYLTQRRFLLAGVGFVIMFSWIEILRWYYNHLNSLPTGPNKDNIRAGCKRCGYREYDDQ